MIAAVSRETTMQSELSRESCAARARRWWIALLVAAVPIVAVLWYRQTTEPYREAERIRVLVISLTGRRPENLTSKQWQSAVAWTNNLHCNSLVWGFNDGPAIRDFRLRLEAKLESSVTMDTIEWIWDEYAALCPLGARYQRWRKVMLDEIGNGGGNWGITIP